jgi:hypothetical protein
VQGRPWDRSAATWSQSAWPDGDPNLIGLLVLSGVIIAETKEYFSEPGWKEPDLVGARNR